MGKKKIVHLIQSLDNGGCENMLLRTLPLLNNMSHEVVVLKNKGQLSDKFEEKEIGVYHPDSLIELIKYLKIQKPKLTVSYLFHADYVGRYLLQIFGFKVIPYLRTTYNFPRYKNIRLLERISRFFVLKYLANSESVKKYYVENMKVDSSKITVIPNGIDINTIISQKLKREEFRRQNGVGESDKIIVCVANFHKNKGHKFLIDAFEGLYNLGYTNLWLWLVGDGEEREKLEKLVVNCNSRDRIIFMGLRNDVPRILGGSDMFVLPTLFEGMSNSIMEAMAAQLPIVTTDIDENKTLVGSSRCLVKSGSSDAILEKMKEYLDDPEQAKLLGRELFEVVKQYDINNIARVFENFLSKEAI